MPIPDALCEQLRSFRVKTGGAFGGFVFATQSDPTRPLSRDSFGHLLAQAEHKAKLPKLLMVRSGTPIVGRGELREGICLSLT